MHIVGPGRNPPMKANVWTSFASAMTADRRDVGNVTIDGLPDDVLPWKYSIAI